MLMFKGKPGNGPMYHATLSESMLLEGDVSEQSKLGLINSPLRNTKGGGGGRGG